MNSFSAIKIEHYRQISRNFFAKIIAILTFPLFFFSTYRWKNPRSATIASCAKYDEFDKITRDAPARVCSASRVNTVLHATLIARYARIERLAASPFYFHHHFLSFFQAFSIRMLIAPLFRDRGRSYILDEKKN